MTAYAGLDIVATQLALYQWVVAASGLAANQVTWAEQNAPRVVAPAISMWLQHIDDPAWPWLDTEENVLVVPTLTVTGVSTANNTLTIAAHGLVTGDGPLPVVSTGTLPAPLAPLTDYWAIVVDANTIQLAATYAATGGNDPTHTNPVTPIDLTTTGSGTITLAGTPDTVRAGAEVTYVSRSVKRMLLTLECYTSDAVGMGMAQAVLSRIQARSALPSLMAILDGANIGLSVIDRVRSVNGHQSVILFEPRAIMEIHLNLVSEESETGTAISTVQGQGLGDISTVVLDVGV